ncbi:organ-specific protein S2-like [Hibiscus syriacus]|uniref:organ-specific protein S2-like n=1 Tax=Hibiscus syriacus TaxID=106335 RepID=UPI00192090F9|nr:organ-specific protein S2-like [Hibiscus syriacus]
MKTSIVFFIFCIFLMFADFSHAREEPRDYWKNVMKDQPMPEAIKGLLHQDQASAMGSGKKMNNFVKDFDSRHSLIIYHSNLKHKDEDMPYVKDLKDQRP